MKFPLEIISQEKIVLKDSFESILLRTLDGDIAVLPHHIPYIGIVKPGEIIVKKDGHEQALASTGGILEVTPEKVVILADSAVRVEEIDEAKAEEAKQRAETLMHEHLNETEIAEVEASLEKALLHISIARKRRHHR